MLREPASQQHGSQDQQTFIAEAKRAVSRVALSAASMLVGAHCVVGERLQNVALSNLATVTS